MVRVALAHKTMPWSFYNMHFPQYKNIVFARDLDVWAPKELCRGLSRKSGIATNETLALSLRSYEGRLWEKIQYKSNNFHIAPITRRKGTNQRYGQKFCPKCMEETPYFRKRWRLSFYVVCPKHKCFMNDRCGNCGKPISYYKFKNGNGFDKCWHCAMPFETNRTKPVHKHSKSIENLNMLLGILDKGMFENFGFSVYSLAFFPVFRQMAKMILKGHVSLDVIQNECKIHGFELSLRKYAHIEDIALEDAFIVFTATVEILKSRKNMNHYILDNGILGHELVQDMKNLPFWYESILPHYSEKKYSPPDEEIKAAVEYLIGKNVLPNYSILSQLFGVCLEYRKRPSISSIISQSNA